MAASANKFAYDRNLYRSGYRTSGNLAVEEEYEEIEELTCEPDMPERSVRTRRRHDDDSEVNYARETKVRTKRHYDFDIIKGILFIACVGLIVYNAYGYLEVKSDITQMKKTIVSANKKLEAAHDRNNALNEVLNVSYDLNMVYEIATKKLHMCYPEENSVVTYELSNHGYVRQYDSIPLKK